MLVRIEIHVPSETSPSSRINHDNSEHLIARIGVIGSVAANLFENMTTIAAAIGRIASTRVTTALGSIAPFLPRMLRSEELNRELELNKISSSPITDSTFGRLSKICDLDVVIKAVGLEFVKEAFNQRSIPTDGLFYRNYFHLPLYDGRHLLLLGIISTQEQADQVDQAIEKRQQLGQS